MQSHSSLSEWMRSFIILANNDSFFPFLGLLNRPVSEIGESWVKGLSMFKVCITRPKFASLLANHAPRVPDPLGAGASNPLALCSFKPRQFSFCSIVSKHLPKSGLGNKPSGTSIWHFLHQSGHVDLSSVMVDRLDETYPTSTAMRK